MTRSALAQLAALLCLVAPLLSQSARAAEPAADVQVVLRYSSAVRHGKQADVLREHVDRVVVWKGGSDVSALAGRPVRLRFRLKDANLYAFRFSS